MGRHYFLRPLPPFLHSSLIQLPFLLSLAFFISHFIPHLHSTFSFHPSLPTFDFLFIPFDFLFSLMLHNTMTNNRMNLFCLLDGDASSNAFSIKIISSDTVDDLKNLIVKGDQAPAFKDLAAKDLILWRVSLPDEDDDNEDLPIHLDNIPSKDRRKLKATTKLSKVFIGELPEDTIHIIVQRPSQSRSGNALIHQVNYEPWTT